MAASPNLSPSSTAVTHDGLPLISSGALPDTEAALDASAATSAQFNAPRPATKADYEAVRQELLAYRPGMFASDLRDPPPHMASLRASETETMNLGIFGFTGTGKSSVTSLLVNAVKNNKFIDLVADVGTGELSHGTRNYCGYQLTRRVAMFDSRGLNYLDMAGDIREVFMFMAGKGCLGYVRRPGLDDAKLAEALQRARHAEKVAAENAANSGNSSAPVVVFSPAELRLIERHKKDYKFDRTPGPLHAVALAVSAHPAHAKAKLNLIRIAFALQAINYHAFVLLVTQIDKLPPTTNWEELRASYAAEFNLPPNKVFLVASYTPTTTARNMAAETEALRMVMQMLRLGERNVIDGQARSSFDVLLYNAGDVLERATNTYERARAVVSGHAATAVKTAQSSAGGQGLTYAAALVLFLAVALFMYFQHQQMTMLRADILNGRRDG